jgi:ribose transport system substrate-binding protein
MNVKKFVTVLLVAMAFVSASNLFADGKKWKIGFSNGFSGNSWRAEMNASLQNEVAKHSDVELVYVDGQGDIAKQVSDIENLIAQEVNAIMIIPLSSQAVSPVLKKARQSGIKVLDFNMPLEDQDAYDVYVGLDMKATGVRWAQWMKDKLGGNGNIVFLGGTPGNSGTAQVLEGINSVFDGTKMKIIANRDAYWQEDRAKVIMADLLAAYPKIDGLMCDGGQVAAGALKAMLAAKRSLVPATGDDYNGFLKIYLANKDRYPKFDLMAISNQTWMSKTVLQTAIKMLNGEKIDKWLKVVPDPITSKNAAQFTKPNMPDTIFTDTDLPDSALLGLNK